MVMDKKTEAYIAAHIRDAFIGLITTCSVCSMNLKADAKLVQDAKTTEKKMAALIKKERRIWKGSARHTKLASDTYTSN